MHKISKNFRDHYRKTFLNYGATSQGVDWGDKEWAVEIRQSKMLEVIKDLAQQPLSLLDVGCGYGALAEIIKKRRLNVNYVGIDVVTEMVSEAKKRHPDYNFKSGDILEMDMGSYDYVVCNGILTQKISASTLEMNSFAQELIKKMFDLCRYGIAFNVMSTHVNFYKDNLYYRNPSELMAWCQSELTPHAKVDCAYNLWYEYTVYLYKKTNLIRETNEEE
jgi:SAM-dependent methyltransferase